MPSVPVGRKQIWNLIVLAHAQPSTALPVRLRDTLQIRASLACDSVTRYRVRERRMNIFPHSYTGARLVFCSRAVVLPARFLCESELSKPGNAACTFCHYPP